MAAPVWPSVLPPPSAPGYSFAPSSGAIETDMDSGFVLVRRRFTAHPTDVPVTWRFIGVDDVSGKKKMQVFQDFFWDTLQAGTVMFDTPLDTGRGLVNVRCQFQHPNNGAQVYVPTLVPGSMDAWDVKAMLRTYASLRSP